MAVSKTRRLYHLKQQEQKIQTQALWANGERKEILLIQLANIRQVMRDLNASK